VNDALLDASSQVRNRKTGSSARPVFAGVMMATALLASPAQAQEVPPEYEVAPELAFQPALMLDGVHAVVRNMAGVWSDRQADVRDSFGRLPAFQADVGSGGVWARIAADSSSSDVRRSLPIEGEDPLEIVNDYDQDIQSLNVGADLIRGTAEGGRRWLAGLTVGYARSSLEFDGDSGTELDFDNVGIGAYASYVSKQWFVDAMLRYDWTKADAAVPALEIALDDPVLSTDVQGASLRVDAGWRIPVTESLRVEPIVGLWWSRIRVDDLNITPSDPLTSGPDGDIVHYDRQENRQLSVGARGSFLQTVGAMQVEYALTARYWHDFERDSEATIRFVDEGTEVDIGRERESGFGEVVAGVSAGGADGQLAGVLNLIGRFSGDTTAYGATVGIRYQW
jgi:hypothetical protein